MKKLMQKIVLVVVVLSLTMLSQSCASLSLRSDGYSVVPATYNQVDCMEFRRLTGRDTKWDGCKCWTRY